MPRGGTVAPTVQVSRGSCGLPPGAAAAEGPGAGGAETGVGQGCAVPCRRLGGIGPVREVASAGAFRAAANCGGLHCARFGVRGVVARSCRRPAEKLPSDGSCPLAVVSSARWGSRTPEMCAIVRLGQGCLMV